jgi:hypothetical protein
MNNNLLNNHTKIEFFMKELAEDELTQKELSLYALGLDWNKLSIVPYNEAFAMSIELVCFLLFAPLYSQCIRAEVFIK